MTQAEKDELKDKIEKYLPIRKKYCDDTNEIRAKELRGEKYPWEADREIKILDDIFNNSNEKKEYNDLVNRINSEEGFEEIFREIHNNLTR